MSPAHMEGPLPCNTFYPQGSQATRIWLLDSLLTSQAMEENKRILNTPVSPWELSDTYPGLQISAILMNTPKIWFWGIRFLRIALKSQHSLTETGDRSSDPWTRRDFSHPGNVNLELANAPTSLCYAVLMLLMIIIIIITYYQLTNLFCLWPGQATTCSASSTKI